eukprot:TRINITY_DN5235_c0_g1_i1.p1 TRINITY_DN5235_c0_g1~~TRINITY_DN5235_c0_g1_i1.p1  ORF type:complete len:725 (+),score=175.75 TRINITY_DN5235_c0_g1_i1:326-2500(+)
MSAKVTSSPSPNGSKPMGLPAPQPLKLTEVLAKLRDPKDGLTVENRSHHFRNYKKSFIGKDLVTFLKDSYGMSRQEACDLAVQLFNAKHFISLQGGETFEDKTHFYRFQTDEEAIQKKKLGKTGKKKPTSTWTGVLHVHLKSFRKSEGAMPQQGTKHYRINITFGDHRVESLPSCSTKFHQKFMFPVLKDVPEWKMNFALMDDTTQLGSGSLVTAPFFDTSLSKQEAQIVLTAKDGEEGPSYNLLIDIFATSPLREPTLKLVPYYVFDELFSNFLIVSAISEAIESPESPINVSKAQSKLLVGAIVDICTRLDKISDLLHYTIHREVARTPSEQLLFRSDNVASHIQTVVLQNTGGIEYLNAVLKDTIQDVLSDPDKYEIDSVSSGLAEYIIIDNQLYLKRAVQALLDKVLGSDALLPSSMRFTIRLLYNTVERYFPGNGPQAAGGMLFLRFLCPALVSPNTWGLLEDIPPPAAKRALLLITKIFQALANNVKVFKEPYMESFNSFLVSSEGKIPSFLNKVNASPDVNVSARVSGASNSSPENVLVCYQAMHVFLHENRNYISTLLVDEEKRWERESKKKKSKSKDKSREKSKDKRKKKKRSGSISDSEKDSDGSIVPEAPVRHSVQLTPNSARALSTSLRQHTSSSSLKTHASSSFNSDLLSTARMSSKNNAALTIVALSDVLLSLSLYPPNKEEKEEKEKSSFIPAQLSQLQTQLQNQLRKG